MDDKPIEPELPVPTGSNDKDKEKEAKYSAQTIDGESGPRYTPGILPGH